MKILLSKELKPYNSFSINQNAELILQADSVQDLIDIWSDETYSDMIKLPLGAGSNTLFCTAFNGVVVLNRIYGKSVIETEEEYFLKVSSGEDWPSLVEWCVDNGLSGIENLAMIPGCAGTAPIQNIGAYGVEISSVIESVTCYNFSTKQIETLTKAECDFSYRHSIFQTKQYLILSVQFRFHKLFKPDLSYPSLVQFLERENISSSNISPAKLSTYIQAIRESKLPSPNVIPNVGSIFKNPIVESDSIDLDFLKGHRWDTSEGQIKLSAARLLETVMPSINIPPSLGFYEKHSLVLINRGGAVFSEVIKLLKDIQDKVRSLYGIDLEIEPEILGS